MLTGRDIYAIHSEYVYCCPLPLTYNFVFARLLDANKYSMLLIFRKAEFLFGVYPTQLQK
jgi:hypothetical protein